MGAGQAVRGKYMIVTAKHHDGFAMYDSKVSEYSITRHAHFPRDPIKELAEVCEAEGFALESTTPMPWIGIIPIRRGTRWIIRGISARGCAGGMDRR